MPFVAVHFLLVQPAAGREDLHFLRFDRAGDRIRAGAVQ